MWKARTGSDSRSMGHICEVYSATDQHNGKSGLSCDLGAGTSLGSPGSTCATVFLHIGNSNALVPQRCQECTPGVGRVRAQRVRPGAASGVMWLCTKSPVRNLTHRST